MYTDTQQKSLLAFVGPTRASLAVSFLLTLTAAAPVGAALPSGTRLPATPIAAGALHAYQLQAGTLKSWGYDGDGRQGIGWTWNSRLTPIAVPGLTKVVQVAVGNAHTLALKSDGTVWAWGYNNHGQVGNGTTNWVNTPVKIAGLSGIKKIATRDFTSYALATDGKLYAWGSNTAGQLGLGTYADALSPVRVLGGLPTIADVGVGSQHAIVADTAGAVWTWGANNFGQLGDFSTTPQTSPKKLTSLTNIKQVAAGGNSNAVVDGAGQMWTWGRGVETGTGGTSDHLVPIKITVMSDVNMVVAGASHALALRKNGEVWTWGANNVGQQGYAGGSRLKPGKVALPSAASIAAGDNNSFVTTVNGQIFSWGANNNGSLGQGFSSSFQVTAAPAKDVRFPHIVLVAPVGTYTQAQIDAYKAWTAQLAIDVLRMSYGQLQLNFDYAGPFPATSAQAGCTNSSTDDRNVLVYGAKAAAAAGKDLSTYGTIIGGWGNDVALGGCQQGSNWGTATSDAAPANVAVSLHKTTATQIGTGLMWMGGGSPDNLAALKTFEMGYGTQTATNPLPGNPGVSTICCCDPNKVPSLFNCNSNPHTFRGQFVISAGNFVEPNVWPWTHANDPVGMKVRMGWLGPSDLTLIDTTKCSTRLNIIPVEATTHPPNTSYGAKISLPLPTGSQAPEASLYVEYRNDVRVGPALANRPGVYGMFQDNTPMLMSLESDAANLDGVAPLKIGTTYTLASTYKVLVNAVGVDANGVDRADITITNTSPSCM